MRTGWFGQTAHPFLLTLTLLGVGATSACKSGASQSRPSTQPWSTGFWFWQGSSVGEGAIRTTPDLLYVQAGHIFQNGNVSTAWGAYGIMPQDLPPAKRYWIVFRADNPGMPSLNAVPVLSRSVAALLAGARRQSLPISGVQLDIDCPTGSLTAYAEFLRQFRNQLPKGMELSITALIDWFRDGTSIDAVIREVDEFVPQYYDVAPHEPGIPAPIAMRFDAVQWSPVLNRFGKRYRIGIAAFGRARLTEAQVSYTAIAPDLRVIDVATNPNFSLQTSRTPAGELILKYRAARRAVVAYNRFEAGSVIEFTLATSESVRRAVEQARRMRGQCAGVLFFRWPGHSETLALPPSVVLHAAGVLPAPPDGAALVSKAGDCAAVSCTELTAEFHKPTVESVFRYRIRSSEPLEYFLPSKASPVRMTGPSELLITLPPYCGRGRLRLGRAVTAKPSKFELEEIP